MSNLILETSRLDLVLQDADEARADVAAISDAVRAEVSAAWLARIEAATCADPWFHGFTMVRREDQTQVGSCGFKGPPDEQGVVEIAYAVGEEQQGKGFATESAEALVQFAFKDPRVVLVRAHTLTEKNASGRVLTKAGFEHVGGVVDPDDGPVWRWERTR